MSEPHTEEVVENADSTAIFKPVVALPEEVTVVTGEEHDETIYKTRCRLYRFASETKEWKERGTGDVKFLKSKETGMVRLVLRQEKTNKLCMNHFVNPLVELKPNAGSDTSWTFSIDDFADNLPKLDTFAIRFKTSEISEAFKKVHDDARDNNKSPVVSISAALSECKIDDIKNERLYEKMNEAGAGVWYSIFKEAEEAHKANTPPKLLSQAEMKKIWDKYDADHNNSLDRSEVAKLCSEALTTLVGVLDTPAEKRVDLLEKLPVLSAMLMAELDTNKDDKISYEEFLQANSILFVFF